MTFRTSLVAVCRSRASVRSRFRASTSVKSLTFSIAMTAWSAKVLSKPIWRSGNGPGLAREMVIAYLPQERVVFQGDLFFVPANDAPAGPPQESTVSFAKKLQELRLEVERIASVHGRTTTIDELKRAMQSAAPST